MTLTTQDGKMMRNNLGWARSWNFDLASFSIISLQNVGIPWLQWEFQFFSCSSSSIQVVGSWILCAAQQFKSRSLFFRDFWRTHFSTSSTTSIWPLFIIILSWSTSEVFNPNRRGSTPLCCPLRRQPVPAAEKASSLSAKASARPEGSPAGTRSPPGTSQHGDSCDPVDFLWRYLRCLCLHLFHYFSVL